ncbi:hypothetical protein I6N90_08535 [Paenibacillus sp. GSMTC-2017]|nr:hypothetical protein [Paenibacillus sp. GSMTC-2017]
MLSCIIFFVLLLGCQFVSKEQKLYQSGRQFVKEKKYPQAIGVFTDLSEFKDSNRLVEKLTYIVNGDYIGVGLAIVAAIRSDGTVIYKGGYEDTISEEEWRNIKAISINGEHLEALNASGEITSTFNTEIEELEQSSLNSVQAMIPVIEQLPHLKGVATFQSDYPNNVVALLEDGTVKVLGTYLSEDELENVYTWKDIKAVEGRNEVVMGLKNDGTVVAEGDYRYRDEVTKWTDIVAISTFYSAFGLKRDGTVVAAGPCAVTRCKVEEWTDIIAIAAGENHTVGLRNDGTVISTGSNKYGQRNIEDWTDIVAIDASYYYTLGLKSDGSLVLAGSYLDGTNLDVTEFSGLMVPQVYE